MFTRKKRLVFSLGILGIAMCIFTGYQISDINRRFPSPEEHGVQAGETFLYQGAEITAVGNKEVYTLEELLEIYQLEESLSVTALEGIKSFRDGYYLCTDIEVFNPTSETIRFAKGYSVLCWPYEMAGSFNGMDYNSYMALNHKYCSDLQPGEVQKLKLVYQINDSSKSREDILEETVKIIYSLYPEKDYIELGDRS